MAALDPNTGINIVGWIGLALTGVGMLLAGLIYIQRQISETDRKVRDDLETRFKRDVDRLELMLNEERTERRRELDRMEKTLEGFADVATAVVAMGKSTEFLAERFSEHQVNYQNDQREIKQSIRDLTVALTRRQRTTSRSSK
jgi:hypothetical protein